MIFFKLFGNRFKSFYLKTNRTRPYIASLYLCRGQTPYYIIHNIYLVKTVVFQTKK